MGKSTWNDDPPPLTPRQRELRSLLRYTLFASALTMGLSILAVVQCLLALQSRDFTASWTSVVAAGISMVLTIWLGRRYIKAYNSPR